MLIQKFESLDIKPILISIKMYIYNFALLNQPLIDQKLKMLNKKFYFNYGAAPVPIAISNCCEIPRGAYVISNVPTCPGLYSTF